MLREFWPGSKILIFRHLMMIFVHAMLAQHAQMTPGYNPMGMIQLGSIDNQ
jgi:hypothetical protein